MFEIVTQNKLLILVILIIIVVTNVGVRQMFPHLEQLVWFDFLILACNWVFAFVAIVIFGKSEPEEKL